MQPLVNALRSHLTADRVRELIAGDHVVVTSGLELLDTSNRVVADISADLAGGKVDRDNKAEVHGTCNLQITRELRWGVDRVRPYLTVGRIEDSSETITEVTTNLAINGSLETVSNGWFYYSGGAGASHVRTTASAKFGTWHYRMTFTNNQTVAADCGAYDLECVQVVPGEAYSVRVWGRTVHDGQTMRASIEWLDASKTGTGTGSAKSHGPTTVVVANEWTEFTVHGAVAPAGAVFARMTLYSTSLSGTGELWLAGETLDVDGYIFVKGLDAPAYFDGDTVDSEGIEHAWVDTAGYSASTKTVTYTNDLSEARFNLGVYVLTTPGTPRGTEPTTWEVDGYDLLTLLATSGPGDTYVVDTGEEYLQAVRDALTAAAVGVPVALDGTSAATTLTEPMVWAITPSGSPSWLEIVNDLLRAVGYRTLWADEDGTYRSGPYVEPSARPVEWTFDTADTTSNLVGQDRRMEQDTFDVPNWWRFVRERMSATPTEGAGLYTVADVGGSPTSSSNVGRVVRKVVYLEAADQASLEAQGNQIVAEDKARAIRFEVKVECLPIAGHEDLVRFIDGGRNDRCLVSSWELPLDGSQGTWVLEVVT